MRQCPHHTRYSLPARYRCYAFNRSIYCFLCQATIQMDSNSSERPRPCLPVIYRRRLVSFNPRVDVFVIWLLQAHFHRKSESTFPPFLSLLPRPLPPFLAPFSRCPAVVLFLVVRCFVVAFFLALYHRPAYVLVLAFLTHRTCAIRRDFYRNL